MLTPLGEEIARRQKQKEIEEMSAAFFNVTPDQYREITRQNRQKQQNDEMVTALTLIVVIGLLLLVGVAVIKWAFVEVFK